MQMDNRQLISANEDHDVPASLSISRQLFPRVRVSLFLETIPARMSWNQEEDYE